MKAKVGDRVPFEGGKIEGTVIEVNWSKIKVRRDDGVIGTAMADRGSCAGCGAESYTLYCDRCAPPMRPADSPDDELFVRKEAELLRAAGRVAREQGEALDRRVDAQVWGQRLLKYYREHPVPLLAAPVVEDLNDPDGVSGGSGIPDVDGDDRLGLEGGRSWRLHLMIERNRGNIKRKKEQVKRDTGSLDCEACGFNFAGFYGDLGGDFCEVHHRLPLSQVDAAVRPDLDDLAIVCSNCHRMIHQTCPIMSVEEFREMLRRLGRLP